MLHSYRIPAGTFASVMHHDGEALEAAVLAAGMSIGKFAKLMGVERNSPRRWFSLSVLPADKREQAAKVLRVDQEDIFPRLAKKGTTVQPPLPAADDEPALSQSGPRNTAQEPMVQYGGIAVPPELERVREERDKWQSLAYENLSKYNALLVEHNLLLRLARLGTTTLGPNVSH